MTDEPKKSNVVSLKSRKPLEDVIKEQVESAELIAKEDLEGHIDAAQKFLDFVKSGRLQGLIIIGKDTQSGLFYNDMIFPRTDSISGCSPKEAMTYVGLLETLKLEFADLASMAPCLMPDGSVLDPMKEPEMLDEEDFE